MQGLEELVSEASDYFKDNLDDYIASVCFEINRLKVNHPDEELEELVSKISLLLKHFDTILVDNENVKNKLDSSLRESASLACKLNMEKKHREQDLNRTFYALEAENEDRLELKKQILVLEDKLSDSIREYNSLCSENSVFKEKILKLESANESLVLENNEKKLKISSLKLSLDAITSDLKNLEYNKLSWEKDKWIEDSVIGAYFSALADTLHCSDILFLDPSVTQMIKCSTPADALDSLKLTNYHTCRYIFLCVNNCLDARKESGGSHWSLLFINKLENVAYHLDSVKSVNEQSAQRVAKNLGIHCSRVAEIPCIQQRQSFECGIHVIANAYYIAHHYCLKQQDINFMDWFSLQNKKVERKNTCQEKMASNAVKQSDKWQSVPVNHKKTHSKEIRQISGTTTHTFTFADKNQFETLNQINEETESCLHMIPFTNKTNPVKCKKPVHNKHRLDTCPSSIKKPRLTVASDSQGRGLAASIAQQNNNNFAVFNSCQPGSPMQPIFESITSSQDFKMYSKADCVTVIAGTNDISNYRKSNVHTLIKNLTTYIEKQFSAFEHTNLIMSTIPYRYDIREDSIENRLIKEINLAIRNLAYKNPHVTILDMYLFQRRYHTRHGLHINRSGKKRAARIILELAKTASSIETTNTSISLRDAVNIASSNLNTSTAPNCVGLNTTTTYPPPTTNNTCTVQVLEADMQTMIDDYKEDPSIAFAHCISGDFEDQRHMSAGVATTFRKMFGRPKRADSLSNSLTLQLTNKQAAVYGLVTKDVYCGKPSESSYDKSFDHLTKDFKSKSFKKLICSPMGCMRDLISPLHFSKNIVKFHRITGAAVIVVIKDERATRTLRNGLTHDKFVTLLKDSIASELEHHATKVVSVAQNKNTLQPTLPTAAESITPLSHGSAAPAIAGAPPASATKTTKYAASSPQAVPPSGDSRLLSEPVSDGVVLDYNISLSSECAQEKSISFLDVTGKANILI